MSATKYNLEQLGWFNFEQLVRTLLREIIGNGISSFSGSVDQGRDASFSGKSEAFPSTTEQWDGDWIFQVKHRTYSTQGAQKSRKELERNLPKEVSKIFKKHQHKCDNYIAITNCPLTAKSKDHLTENIKAVSKKIKQVYIAGESDLHELLDTHPKIVSAFPQLLGISQLQQLLQWGLHHRSIEYLHAAQSEIATFVATNPYINALDLLHKQHFCILSGPPKMGKTCTAYALAAAFSAQSYEIYDLRSQQDYYNAYNATAKQVFICDDVFGDIALNPALRDEWARGFLRLIGKLDINHKLIWTARAYILKEAIESSRLKEERPTLNTIDNIIVEVDQLSQLERALILYNHAKAANLPADIRDYLRTRACIKIINDPNYSPESIRQLCTGRLVTFSQEAHSDQSKIDILVQQFLATPGAAWKTAFLASPAGERLLCNEVMASGGSINKLELKSRYDQFVQDSDKTYQSFDVSLANAQGTFLRSKQFANDEYIQFYHPSMRDLLAELIQENATIRSIYINQLKLNELAGLAFIAKDASPEGSSMHRIPMHSDTDTDLLRQHITNKLLLNASLVECFTVVNSLYTAKQQVDPDGKEKNLRQSSKLTNSFWTIVDTIIPHVCSNKFWLVNSSDQSKANLFYWRSIFKNIRKLLLITDTLMTPEYIPELLTTFSDLMSVDYWGLAATAHEIAPLLVERHIDLNQKEICRQRLIKMVSDAIEETNEIDLEENYEDSQQWHDTYESLPDDCNDYAAIFPYDEEIPRVDELKNIFDQYPRLEQEPEVDYYAARVSKSEQSQEILHLFSDL